MEKERAPDRWGEARDAIRVYLINLDRAPDRLAVMAERLKTIGLPFERVPAIDGRGIDLATADRRRVDERRYGRCHGKVLNPNEVGCYWSHVRAMETFLASDAEFGLILEDDVSFDEDLPEVLEALLACSGEWDVAKLSGRHSGWPVPKRQLTPSRRLVTLLARHTGAGAYLINRYAAECYLRKLLPMVVPYDHAFDKEWVFGFKFRGIDPPPIPAQMAPNSTIGDGFHAEKKKWYRRGSVFVYRLCNESCRAFNALVKGYWIPRLRS